MSEEIDLFVEEYTARRDARKGARAAWQNALQANTYLATSPNPERLPEFFGNDPTKTSADVLRPFNSFVENFSGGLFNIPDKSDAELTEIGRNITQYATQKRSDFTKAFEAELAKQGYVDDQFLLNYTPADLRLMGGFTKEEIGMVEQVAWEEELERKRQQDIDAAVERAVTERERLSNWTKAVNVFGAITTGNIDLGNLLNFGDTSPLDPEAERERQELLAYGRGDEIYNNEISTWRDKTYNMLVSTKTERDNAMQELRQFAGEEDPGAGKRRAKQPQGAESWATSIMDEMEANVRLQLRNSNADVTEVLDTDGLLTNAIEGGLNLMGKGVGLAAQGGTGLVGMASKFVPDAISPYRFMKERAEEERDQTIAESQQYLAMDEQDVDRIGETMMSDNLRGEWSRIQEEDPEFYQERLAMAGFDPVLAFSIFATQVKDMPEAAKQMEQLAEQRLENDFDMVRQLQEADFRVSDTVLNALGSWGRFVNQMAITTGLFLLDEDYNSKLVTGQFENLWTEVRNEARTYESPSEAVGIDGTLSGLMVDLGAGIAFDPTTWLFGPRGAIRSVKSWTLGQVAELAKSPMVRQFMREAVEAAMSPQRGAVALVHLTRWMDDLARGEFLAGIGWKPSVLPRGGWSRLPGHTAQEVQTTLLREIAGPAQPGLKPVKGLLERGFDEPLTVEISRVDGAVRLADGHKRLATVEGIGGIDHIPAQFRVVDELFTPQMTTQDPVWAQLAQGKGMKLSKQVLDKTTQQQILAQTDLLRKSGLKVNHVADVDGMVVNRISQSGTNFFWLEGPNGDIIAAVSTPSSGGGSAAVQAGLERGGFFTKLIEAAETFDPNIVMTMSKSESVSKSAANWIQKYAANKKIATPNKVLDDFLMDGEKLGADIGPVGSSDGLDVNFRPDQILPRRAVWGEMNEELLTEIATRAIKNGAVPDGAYRGLIAQGYHDLVGKYVKNSTPNSGISRYTTQHATIQRLELAGPGHMERIYDITARLWGDDMVGANRWTEAIMLYERELGRSIKNGVDQLTALQPLRQHLDQLEDMTGGGWDDSLRTGLQSAEEGALSAAARNQLEVALSNRKLVQKTYTELKAQWDDAYSAAHQQVSKMPNTRALMDVVADMYDDFNRMHIATNEKWAHLVDDNGLVPWEHLRKGSTKKKAADQAKRDAMTEGRREFLPSDLKEAAEVLGIDGNELAKKLLTTQDMPMAMELPITPLDMILAKSTGGARYTQWTHHVRVSQARELAFAINKMWVIDKVFRASTAITVSFDELLRIWHIGGPEASVRYARDRAMFMEARVKAAMNGGTFWKEGVARGAQYLSPAKQERLRALQNIPNHLKAAERQVYDGAGLGWTDIDPSDSNYMDAASRWTGGLMQDSGFRAYMRGPEAFREWYHGIDGQHVREMTILDKDATGSIGSRVLAGADEAYEGFNNLFEKIILKEAHRKGNFAEVRQAFKDTAQKIDELGGRSQELPAFVYDNLGPVRGTQKHMGKTFSPSGLTEKFFDNLFMRPVQYRRGFLAEMTRKTEGARVRQLLALQGKRIVNDMELENILGMKGMEGATRAGAKPFLHEAAQRAGLITESMVDDIVERAVMKELDNVLFTWDKGSRAGSQGRVIFPFGRPWGDMMGFWGREMLRKPVTRGIWNEKNFLGIKQLPLSPLMKGIEKFVPFNPKPAAMISRLAETDFTIGGGPGDATQTDFSPIFFLPTKGDNPFAAMIPGLGPVPMQLMDMVLDRMVDPVEDPLEYQELLDNISDFLPMFRYQQGGVISRAVGGGAVGAAAGVVVDVLAKAQGEVGQVDTYFGFTSKMGDITREINRTREMSAILANDEQMAMLLEEQNQEDLELLLMSMAQEADGRASGSHAAQVIQRWVVPASSRYDTSIAEILDVWVNAAEAFPQLLPRGELDPNDPASVRQYASDVRSKFFDLDDWERDLMISQQPSLAVNLISSWEWTSLGESANLPGVEKSYRTGGSAEDHARHQYYVENGFVRPLQPLERARRVLGMVFAAKENAAKEIYTTSAAQVNTALWDQVVSPETKDFLGKVVRAIGSDWDIRDEKEMWDNWSSMESRFEEWLADDLGIDKKSETYQELRSQFGIPTSEKPWGTTWPGIDPDDSVSGKFREIKFPSFDPKVTKLAEGLGLTLTPGMTGEQLYGEVQSVLTEIDGPAMAEVKSTYDQYVQGRSVPSNTAENLLRRTAHNVNYNPEWRGTIEQFMVQADSISERYRGAIGGIPVSEAQKIADMYNGIKAISPQEIGWDKIWEDRYERTYGALDWIPPEPLSPFTERGNVKPEASAPYFKKIIDGDSFEVVENRGSGTSFEVRLLGVKAADYSSDPEGARAAHRRLEMALQAGAERGDTIYIVRDPDTFGASTDYYGRMLAWLWIGDEPYYDPESFDRGRDPDGGDS